MTIPPVGAPPPPQRQQPTPGLAQHILVGLLLATTDAATRGFGDRPLAGQASLILRWFIFTCGVLSGGMLVYLTAWLVALFPFWLAYLVATIVVVGGPDLLPPATLCNGCESPSLRIIWSIVTWVSGRHYLLGWNNTQKALWILSALWHVDEANRAFHQVSWCVREWFRTGCDFSEQEISDTNSFMLLQFYRAGAGIGMLGAVFYRQSTTSSE